MKSFKLFEGNIHAKILLKLSGVRECIDSLVGSSQLSKSAASLTMVYSRRRAAPNNFKKRDWFDTIRNGSVYINILGLMLQKKSGS